MCRGFYSAPSGYSLWARTHRSSKENLSNNQVLLKLVIICVILMTLVRDSGVIL